jgi:hypothetical protein
MRRVTLDIDVSSMRWSSMCARRCGRPRRRSSG